MENPYLEAQREWDERFAFHARQARIAFSVAGILLLVSICMGGVVVWQSLNRTYIPYVVSVDSLGRAEMTQSPRSIGEWPISVVRREVSDLVRLLRAVPGDSVVLTADMRQLLLFTLPGTAALAKIKERGLDAVASPFVRQKLVTVRVEIVAANLQGGTTWLVEWSETTRARDTGALVGTERYQGTFQLGAVKTLSPEVLEANPLGIAIIDFDIQRLGSQ